MIDYLKGTLLAVSAGKAVLEIGGVGLSLDIPPVDDPEIRAFMNQEITFYTRVVIKDEEIFIYAFRTAEERKLFNLILTVSGFGPRLALSMLAIFSVSELYVAVLEENVAQLCRAHGVGRKAAQRLILELKEKLPTVISTEELAAAGPVSATGYTVVDDLTEALCTLGYSGTEAYTAVKGAVDQNKDLSREELLKIVLKNMANK